MSAEPGTYICHCGHRAATVGASMDHALAEHPETVETVVATPAQMAPGLAMLAQLRGLDNRNLGKPRSEWVQGAPGATTPVEP